MISSIVSAELGGFGQGVGFLGKYIHERIVSIDSWSREVTRSEMEYIQVHVNGAIKRGKVLGPLTLQFRINHVSAVDFAHGFRP